MRVILVVVVVGVVVVVVVVVVVAKNRTKSHEFCKTKPESSAEIN